MENNKHILFVILILKSIMYTLNNTMHSNNSSPTTHCFSITPVNSPSLPISIFLTYSCNFSNWTWYKGLTKIVSMAIVWNSPLKPIGYRISGIDCQFQELTLADREIPIIFFILSHIASWLQTPFPPLHQVTCILLSCSPYLLLLCSPSEKIRVPRDSKQVWHTKLDTNPAIKSG